MRIDGGEVAASQASHMLTHPWDLPMWSAWWGAGLQNFAQNPISFWRAAIDAQVRQANAWLDWLESLEQGAQGARPRTMIRIRSKPVRRALPAPASRAH